MLAKLLKKYYSLEDEQIEILKQIITELYNIRNEHGAVSLRLYRVHFFALRVFIVKQYQYRYPTADPSQSEQGSCSLTALVR